MLLRKSNGMIVAMRELAKRWVLPALVVLLFVVRASAQAPESPTAAAAQSSTAPHRHARLSIDDRVAVFAKNLDLSATQQAQLKAILEQRQQDILQIRSNPSLSGEARIDCFRALQDQTVERIRTILTDDQKKRYDPLAVRKVQQQQNPDVDSWLAATRPH